MILVILNAKVLAFPVFEHQRPNEDILCVNTAEIAQCQRPIVGRVIDRPPEVNYLEPTFFQEFRCFGWRKVPLNAYDGCFVGLVDMDLGNGLASVRSVIDLSWTATANGFNKSMISFLFTQDWLLTHYGRIFPPDLHRLTS